MLFAGVLFYLRVTVAFGSHLCYNGVARRARSSFRCCTVLLNVYVRRELYCCSAGTAKKNGVSLALSMCTNLHMG